MVSKAEATENFCKGLSLALAEGKELAKPPDMTEILKIGERRNEKETDPEAILNSWSVTGKLEEMRAMLKATEELSAFVQKERLAVLNLCLPEAKEKTNE